MQSMKAITKWLLGAAMAGAFFLAVPHQAQAQTSFGVAVGGCTRPAYVLVPARYDNWQRREYFEHQRWERDHWRWERDHSWRDRRYYR